MANEPSGKQDPKKTTPELADLGATIDSVDTSALAAAAKTPDGDACQGTVDSVDAPAFAAPAAASAEDGGRATVDSVDAAPPAASHPVSDGTDQGGMATIDSVELGRRGPANQNSRRRRNCGSDDRSAGHRGSRLAGGGRRCQPTDRCHRRIGGRHGAVRCQTDANRCPDDPGFDGRRSPSHAPTEPNLGRRRRPIQADDDPQGQDSDGDRRSFDAGHPAARVSRGEARSLRIPLRSVRTTT